MYLYLIALWGKPFDLAAMPATNPGATDRPCIDRTYIRLPSEMTQQGHVTAQEVYIASAVHAAARRMDSQPLRPKTLSARQRYLIELVEDARVEYLTFLRFPRLRQLWLDLHPSMPPDPTPFATLMWRLSRGLLELEISTDDDFLVRKAIALFQENSCETDGVAVSREIGLRLAQDIGQMRLPMNEDGLPTGAIYRDDNQHLWLE
ncbi:Rubisco activation protein CbbO (plasmid) [Acidithiobacillus caldus ATCC 51756]|uniref:Rubisco activation protein CbbO n=1 Tax=Acidithiobacillus caldus (strain ATCC 51756 / DSM 8584 / KU) TaxID=637389 RepID=A0A059ZYJ5_ACICK|nr:Rubisco activation protein CbbO [Acidithiobacillus caldus ATCC 51756]